MTHQALHAFKIRHARSQAPVLPGLLRFSSYKRCCATLPAGGGVAAGSEQGGCTSTGGRAGSAMRRLPHTWASARCRYATCCSSWPHAARSSAVSARAASVSCAAALAL